MFKIKEKELAKYKKWGLTRKISQKTGLTEGYISQVINQRKTDISKVSAYAITKAINNELEIENLFDIM